MKTLTKKKQPWQTSDLALVPNISSSSVTAEKQSKEEYKLFYTNTNIEFFKGETFKSAFDAKQFFKTQQN